MKITYTPNPLTSVVELEEHEVELMRLRIKVNEMEDMLFQAHFNLVNRQQDMGSLKALTPAEAIAEAVKELDPDYWCQDGESRLDRRVDELTQHYVEALKDSHAGDCNAFPASCSKCHAEELLGINTLGTYPGKQVLHSLYHTFNYREGDVWKDRPVSEVLSMLSPDAHAYLTQHLKTHHLETT
jgi:hypothetical protein